MAPSPSADAPEAASKSPTTSREESSATSPAPPSSDEVAGSPAKSTLAAADSAESTEPNSNGSGDQSNRSTPEPGLIDETAENDPVAGEATAPPLPDEVPPSEAQPSAAAAPPLPAEAAPSDAQQPDDGWEPVWNPNTNSWWFYNHYTGVYQTENPRVPYADSTTAAAVAVPIVPPPPDVDPASISDPASLAGGYNPRIHGSYDPNAWYAKNTRAVVEQESATAGYAAATSQQLANGSYFNRQTGQWQMPGYDAQRHSDDAKSTRQMNAFFDVDAAANQHDGRSLKAERAGKKPTKTELKAFKEKRRTKKEEKRRAWLRD